MRAPLAALEAASALLSAHAEEPEMVRRCAVRMQAACMQLRELAEDMLEPAPFALRNAPCRLREILLDAAALVETRVDIEMSGCCDVQMLADAQRIRRILLNLLSNAVKFSPAGERVALIASACEEEGCVRISVSVRDRGIGMSAATMQTLFEPRRRGKEAAGIPGYGLGLCGAHALAEAMGARLYAQSRLGEGSTFTLEASFPALQTKALAGKRFLLAEDQALLREAMQELLAECGAQTECAEDGETAVRLYRTRPEGWFDAVLMDVVMPGMDGFEAARGIRQSPRKDAKRVPIFALTGASSEAVAAQVKACGMNAHAVKPASMGEISWLLERTAGEK